MNKNGKINNWTVGIIKVAILNGLLATLTDERINMVNCNESEVLSYGIIVLVVWLRPKLSIADVNNEGIAWTIEANMVW